MTSRRIRKFLAPLVAVALAAVSAASLVVLERRASGYRIAQATLADASAKFALVSAVPLDLLSQRGALLAAGKDVDQSETEVMAEIERLNRSWPIPELTGVTTHVKANFVAINTLQAHAVSSPAKGKGGVLLNPTPVTTAADQGTGTAPALPLSGPDATTDLLARHATAQERLAKSAMQRANAAYDQLATSAQTEALIATFAAIAVLLGAFLVFYFRWLGILRRSEHDALSDALTGLGNRRALVARLERELPAATREHPLVLTLYDLDGFKAYNDTFGHPAGDALLARFAERLQETLGPAGRAYRMGGDEFCSLARVEPGALREHVARARGVLTESGDGFAISCSAGSVVLPDEASTPHEALSLADRRMYEHKGISRRRLEASVRYAAQAG